MPKSTDAPPVPGANSFTEAQAKDRMEKAGFTQVINLKKDDAGIWRGSAMQDGKQVKVSLDFRGNVVATQ
jgi:putative membrane protein